MHRPPLSSISWFPGSAVRELTVTVPLQSRRRCSRIARTRSQHLTRSRSWRLHAPVL